MKTLILMGHSHVYAIWDAIVARRQCNSWPEQATLSFIPLKEGIYEPFEARFENNNVDTLELNPRIVNDLSYFIENASGDCTLFCQLGGMHHNFFSLANHPRPIDFVLPEEPDLPLEAGAEIIPASLLRQMLADEIRIYTGALKILRRLVNIPIYQLEAPPPIGDNGYIQANPAMFDEPLSENGVSPPLLRYKSWRLHAGIVRQECVEHGVGYVAAPADCLDGGRFLAREGAGGDPVHASQWYGERVLRQMLKIAGLVDPEEVSA